ncbi:triacylglycerol lipase-like protein [Thalictrum thalictroides]|uniref:Triacylglycerol lipase-like protein n=1 Tax=Thalictrum thalictroides TaxID=46969 RepID=A0A7J6WYC3_THATH|nr:triacylglycerol lipase-like protein [Thalictrum thalictroides]
MKNSHHIEHDEMKKIISRGNVSTAACIATAGTTLAIGYGLGFRGGIWYANRKFKKEQLKLLGQIKPQRFHFLKRPLARLRGRYGANKNSEALPNNAASVPVKHTSFVNS